MTVVLRTGADVLETMTDAYIGNPGELSTGDKKMGGIQYTMMSAEHLTTNLDMTSAKSMSDAAAGQATAGVL